MCATRFIGWSGKACLNCEDPIDKGLFCDNCAPQMPQTKLDLHADEIGFVTETLVSEMSIGQTGFTEPYAFLKADGLYFVIASAKISAEPADFKTTKISLTDKGFVVDRLTLEEEWLTDCLEYLDTDQICFEVSPV